MKTILTALFIASISSFASVESATDAAPHVSFGTFPLPIVRTYISSAEGTSSERVELNRPFPKDFPPSTTVGLEASPANYAIKKGARYFFPSQNILRVYRISNVEGAPYKTIKWHIAYLKTLLHERPTVAPSGSNAEGIKDQYLPLPDYPPRNAGQSFQLKLSYLDAEWGSGIFYITQFTQDGGTAANNEELTYIFQGISKDEAFYVSADIHITHPRLPATVYDAPHSKADDYAPDERLISKQADNSFNPSLSKIAQWIASLTLK